METLAIPPCLFSDTPAADVDSFVRRPRAFDFFGNWQEEITIAKQGALWRLADWLARYRKSSEPPKAAWLACQRANPSCFKTFAVIRLERPSFFLPAREVVFEVIKNPTQVPGHPPQGVMLRHLEAMDAFPDATFFYLEPVFTSEPCLRLYPASELRDEAHGDQQDAMMLSRNYGWLFRTANWATKQKQQLVRKASRLADEVEGRLRTATESLFPQLHRARDLERLARRADTQGRFEEAIRLRRSLAEILWHMTIDPLLCFELPDRPGRLWFEAHWYLGSDSRTYVHF